MSFKAPNNYLEIFDNTIERVLKLIDLKYIDNIDKGTLRNWIQNFSSPEEKYFAALILNKLIYRSEKAILTMCENIIELVLPEIFSELNIYDIKDLDDWKKSLVNIQQIKLLPFRITTITGIDNNIGKSGDDLNRLLKEKYIIHKNININLLSNVPIPSHVTTLIVIDDIVGTGTQFSKFMRKYQSKLKSFQHIIYVPLVAYSKSLKNIRKLDSRVYIRPLEILEEDKQFFNNSNRKFDNLNSYKDLKVFYESFLLQRNLVVPASEYTLNTLYVFKISSPNTNLPLIYCNDDQWNKLFIRF